MIQLSKNITTFAVIPAKNLIYVNRGSFFYGYLKANIERYRRLSNPCGYYVYVVMILGGIREAIAFFVLILVQISFTMPRINEICDTANNSTCKQRQRTKRAILHEPQLPVQVIHQIVIPETPVGLIGEKVVYSDRYLKWCDKRDRLDDLVQTPDCGYFTITKAVLQDDGRVMVALHPYPSWRQTFRDGTNICIGNMKKYNK